MKIRQETPKDYKTIYNFVKTAFETAKVKDGNEQDYVNTIRQSPGYLPELSLVAVEKGKIIGHIMLSETYIDDGTYKHTALLLAPLSVKLEYRNKGIGSELITEGIKLAEKMGYKTVFLAGDPNYYNRFGFVATIDHNIKSSLDLPEEFYKNIMVYEIVPNALQGITGIIKM